MPLPDLYGSPVLTGHATPGKLQLPVLEARKNVPASSPAWWEGKWGDVSHTHAYGVDPNRLPPPSPLPPSALPWTARLHVGAFPEARLAGPPWETVPKAGTWWKLPLFSPCWTGRRCRPETGRCVCTQPLLAPASPREPAEKGQALCSAARGPVTVTGARLA